MNKLSIFNTLFPNTDVKVNKKLDIYSMSSWRDGGYGNWSNSTNSWKDSDGWSNSTQRWKDSGYGQWSNSTNSWKDSGYGQWSNSTNSWKDYGGWSNSSGGK